MNKDLIIEKTQRTIQQNRALHLYLTWVSSALNDAGYSIEEVLKHFTMELEWTPEAAKEILWRTAQQRMLKKKSTTELNKQGDIDKIWEVMNRFLGERLHIESIPWPSEEQVNSVKINP